jgi:hypothetical protein
LTQRRWRRNNPDYFRGPLHVARVQHWRKNHPGWVKPFFCCHLRTDISFQRRDARSLGIRCRCFHPLHGWLQDFMLIHPVRPGPVTIHPELLIQDFIRVFARQCYF